MIPSIRTLEHQKQCWIFFPGTSSARFSERHRWPPKAQKSPLSQLDSCFLCGHNFATRTTKSASGPSEDEGGIDVSMRCSRLVQLIKDPLPPAVTSSANWSTLGLSALGRAVPPQRRRPISFWRGAISVLTDRKSVV